jgi:hypothetical protein
MYCTYAQRCHWHYCACHSGVIDTAEPCAAESDFLIKTVFRIINENIPKSWLHWSKKLAPLRYAQRCHWHRCDMHNGIIDTAVTCTEVSLTPLCNQLCRFSPRIRSHIQKGCNPCIMGLGGVVWWKKPVVENLVSWPLQEIQTANNFHVGSTFLSNISKNVLDHEVEDHEVPRISYCVKTE